MFLAQATISQGNVSGSNRAFYRSACNDVCGFRERQKERMEERTTSMRQLQINLDQLAKEKADLEARNKLLEQSVAVTQLVSSLMTLMIARNMDTAESLHDYR